jgi:dihydrofolate reductase
MSKLVVRAYSISLDGYGAGPDQSLAAPLGVGGEDLHGWFVRTSTFRTMIGKEGGAEGLDEAIAARSMQNLGAWIMGRHMFTHERGPWKIDWRGWWGEAPPYHCDVYVLTHHARDKLEMDGGTTFHFVTGGPDEALERARASAGDRDIRVGGGAATIRQYLKAGQIDEMHIAVTPVLLGRGEPLFAGLDLPALGYAVATTQSTDLATHVTIAREDR